MDYHDHNICSLLWFGLPINGEVAPVGDRVVKNHSGTTQFARHIDQYLKKEIALGAVLGPFKSNPFPADCIISPLNSTPKKDSQERRVILDLSFPKGKGTSVNAHIDAELYGDMPMNLTYPGVDDFIRLIHRAGLGCHMFKRDLK